MSTPAKINPWDAADYLGTAIIGSHVRPIERPEPVEVRPVQLNWRAWGFKSEAEAEAAWADPDDGFSHLHDTKEGTEV